VQGAEHRLVLNKQLEHFNVPLYPVKRLEQVWEFNAVPSHCSVPSIALFPQEAAQLLSLTKLQPLPVGQHPSLFAQAVIELCAQRLLEQLSVVQTLLSLHCAAEVQQLDTGELTQALFVQLSVVQTLLSLHCAAELQQLGVEVYEHSLLTQLSVVQALLSLHKAGLQGATHWLVLNKQLVQPNIPLYPPPITPEHVAPPRLSPSHFSVPSRIPFPHA
jgi:hypothetical protein